MRLKEFLFTWLILCLFTVSGYAQDKVSLGIEVTPGAFIPTGKKSSNYAVGMGTRVEGLVGTPLSKTITPYVDLAYGLVPLNLGDGGFPASVNLNLLRGGIGAKGVYSFSDRASLFARGYSGVFYAALSGNSTGNAVGWTFGVGGGAGIQLSPQLSLGGGICYETYVDLYNTFSVWLGTSIRITGKGNSAIPRSGFISESPSVLPENGFIRFTEVELDRLFPVLYKYYDDRPIGTATVLNIGDEPVEEVVIRLKLKQFMDAPKVSARIERCIPGEENKVDIYALFTEDILSVTEGAKVAAELSAEYSFRGKRVSDNEVITLNTYNRNALQWDDDRKIAAFVTARDEEVQRFSRNIATLFEECGIREINRELQIGMLLLCAMAEHNCSYVIDPSSPYSALSSDTAAIDSVQFPRQTLQYRAGDCDDLSSTYAALLESVGIETAFITVPGHIFTAFRVPIQAQEAARIFKNPGDVITAEDGSIWIPVETTLLKDGFLTAWSEGVRQWRVHQDKKQAVLIPIRQAWKLYEPVAFGVSDYEVDIPTLDVVAHSFKQELSSFVSQQISEREAILHQQIDANPNDLSIRNKLGVLYARYGRYDQARQQFSAVLQVSTYVPALINSGNVAYLSQNYEAARQEYQKVLDIVPRNRAALLGLARTEYVLKNYTAANIMYAKLQSIYPEIAGRFSFLGTDGGNRGRASDLSDRSNSIMWEE